ncbi:[protein-PII] uridylyltransferase [Inmirania thermothiophila]|uniref:Bifunctional uridylyltransferase/uridylyl-removing enzyme n=1 Tax=Inmirania thermothiophila TaxID=1750597 RepID=A0A3N1Y3Q4_9GAMM|nr:[protein-PII] uridylyltransferase [Inmirania thermothiophila]ROR32212.1 UTP--GlnB (protein PII) uridylyltransferase GlnD [Inmirania thermothiophila]
MDATPPPGMRSRRVVRDPGPVRTRSGPPRPAGPLLDPAALDQALAAGADPLEAFRRALAEGTDALAERFRSGVPAAMLVGERARLIDQLLRRAWDRLVAAEAGATMALVAVGGYGRGELHPHSDIDLLILLEAEPDPCQRGVIESFLAFLWDIGLEVGQSVRTVEACAELARADITVATSLMEARLLAGPRPLFERMAEAVGPDRMWPSRAFFEAKLAEQQARHAKFHDTAYNLEPNVKEGPGGLRDLQTVAWVAKRHFRARDLHDLVARGFLTEDEHHDLVAAQGFLWDVRFALHLHAGRREDRLLLDHQQALARAFGFRDDDQRLAVEKFMKRYYRTVMELQRLTEMLLQLFSERILHADEPGEPVPLNRRFQARHGYIEAVSEEIFRRYPFALLEIFLLLAQHPELKGVRATTIRLIRAHRHLIDGAFRRDLRNRALFMEILRQPQGITKVLRRMNRYGVLAAYIPAFGRIVGQMQYDLFHVYTVDEHTLFVLRNLRRFTVPEHRHEFPHCSEIIERIPKLELLYLAALFHDIGKGRGGDHSEIGAEEAERFCREHLLSAYDTELVTWLVRHHLLLSTTAQRRDIGDPEVVNEFARRVGDQTRLDYLYLLTVADVRATNPAIWNSWKDALFHELYALARRALRRGLENPVDRAERVRGVRALARAQLRLRGLPAEAVEALWRTLPEEYFLRTAPDEVAWHTETVIHAGTPPVVALRRHRGHAGTAVLVYCRDEEHVFALTTSMLDRLGLNVADARIIPTLDGHTVDVYLVLEDDGGPVAEAGREEEVRMALLEALRSPPRPIPLTPRRASRQLRHFRVPTVVEFSQDERNGRTVVGLVCADRPGLLSRVGRAFADCGVRLRNAKVATVGERAEDFFYVTDREGRPLDAPERQACVREALLRYLESG